MMIASLIIALAGIAVSCTSFYLHWRWGTGPWMHKGPRGGRG
jgi:hypothetical protein